MPIPIINLANFPSEKEKLLAAVTGPGCFRVINHDISPMIISNMRACMRGLFDLPSEVKRLNTDIVIGSGYLEPNRVGSLYEAMGIYDAASPNDVLTFCSHLGVSLCDREILSVYSAKVHDLIVELASRVAECLGIVNCSFKEWSCQLRMNRYDFTEKTIGSSGVRAHTDLSFITILLEDELNDGLEIMDSTGNFVTVDPIPGTLFVNVGDIGKVWSNGRLHNVMHRVICKKGEPRMTVALFLAEPKTKIIEPRAELIDSQHPQLYGNVDCLEYRKLRILDLLINGDALLKWVVDKVSPTT